MIPLPASFSQLPIFLLQAHAEGGEEQMSMWDTIVHSNLINVLIIAAGLAFLIKKFNLFGGIDGQRAKIAGEIESLELQKKQALDELDDVKRKTANLTAEIEEILATAKSQAESLSSQIVTDARTEASKIVENSKKRVELEQRAAMKSLEQRLLNDALSDARAELAQNLTAKDQARSVEAFLDELAEAKGA